MATLLFVVVDPNESRMHWVNASHPAPLLVAGEGVPQFLERGGSVLPGASFPTYEPRTVPMTPAARLVLYTDGLIERPGEHLDDGMKELLRWVREAPDDPERLCDHLLRTLIPATGATDDVAILALRNLPSRTGSR